MNEDELDKLLYHNLQTQKKVSEETSKKLNKIIYESIYEDIQKRKYKQYSFFKIFTTICASLLLFTGIAYATTKVYKKIFKQPKEISGFYSNINTISKEEKNTAISEENSRKKAKEILKIFGYENEKIKSIKLINNPDNNKLIWQIKTNNEIFIELDAINQEYYYIRFDSILNKNIQDYRTTSEEAENTARNICKKYGYNLDEYTGLTIRTNTQEFADAYIWYIDFYKEYDGIKNPYQSISIAIIPEINELYYFKVKDIKFEDTLVQVSEDTAKNVAIEAEEKVNDNLKVKDIFTELAIIETNGNAYFRQNDYDQYYIQMHDNNYPTEKNISYQVDSLVRKAWLVTFEFNIDENSSYNMIWDQYYTYYIDVETGEIIGRRFLLWNAFGIEIG